MKMASTLPPPAQAENRSAVVDEVELDVAAAPLELRRAVGFRVQGVASRRSTSGA